MKVSATLVFASLWAIAIGEVREIKPELAEISHHQSSVLNAVNPDDASGGLRDTSPHISAYDPAVVADQATWDKYAARGGQLVCTMRKSDEYAGTAMGDTRVPHSAESV